jgi:hypothetical protein
MRNLVKSTTLGTSQVIGGKNLVKSLLFWPRLKKAASGLSWILATGTWDDTGVWDDTANWLDSAP